MARARRARRAWRAGLAWLAWRLALGAASACALLWLAWPGAAAAGQGPAQPPPHTVADTGADAFSHMRPGLDDGERALFMQGRSLFRRAWIAGPRSDGDGRGLGPLYNRLSCLACHAGNGRGQAPAGPDERMQSMLVRLSVEGTGPHGAPRPHPAYGEQLNEEGVHGVAGEGRARLHWVPVLHRAADGTRTVLRRPRIEFDELAYGPMGRVLHSPRVGSVVYGMGLLGAVPDAALQALAWLRQPDGVRGRLNRVWDPVQQRMAIGRFGWKANTATVQAQVVQAAQGDLGLSSLALPGSNCAAMQPACAAAAAAEGIDLLSDEVQALAFYMNNLAPPAPRGAGDITVQRGRQLFSQARCVVCHLPSLPQAPGIAPIQPYTDLLLHDMGAGLADGRPDYRASGRQWRTAPLWGLGLVPRVNEHSHYLHDGRARDLREAVLWHGGEASRARQRFERFSAEEQAALLAFVASL